MAVLPCRVSCLRDIPKDRLVVIQKHMQLAVQIAKVFVVTGRVHHIQEVLGIPGLEESGPIVLGDELFEVSVVLRDAGLLVHISMTDRLLLTIQTSSAFEHPYNVERDSDCQRTWTCNRGDKQGRREPESRLGVYDRNGFCRVCGFIG